MTKLVSQLDITGRFIGSAVADLSPLEPGVYLLPGGAVDANPPDVPEGMFAQWNGSGFDFIIIPVLPPDPPPKPPSKEELNAPILAQLAALDLPRTRPLTDIVFAIISGEPIPKYSKDKLIGIEAQADELRKRIIK